MLRWVISLLLVANAGFYLWSHGYLAALGLAPVEQQEPERLSTQIRPEVMRLLNAPDTTDHAPPHPPAESAANRPTMGQAEPPSVDAAMPDLPPTACWLAKGFNTEQIEPLRQRMFDLALPKGSWQIDEERSGGRWVVYMGRYNEDMMARKKEELRQLKVDFRALTEPPLGPGLALGTYSSAAAAEQGLNDVVRKGVRSARVAKEREGAVSHTLRLAEVTEEERAAVMGLGPELLAGKTLQRCN